MAFKFVFLFLLMFSYVISAETTIDHQIFDQLLKKHVKEKKVDYANFINDRKELQAYLKKFEFISTTNLNKNEKLALYINAYNAFTIELILQNYSKKLKSIKDIKSPWDIKFCNIGGSNYSLNEIENTFLRDQLKEPRVHFAINCASISCPPLQDFAFSAEKIDAQLDDVTNQFMMNPLGVKISQNTLEISQIFNWFKGDFESKEKNVLAFILQYLTIEVKKTLPEVSKIKIKYQEYNWNLNDLKKEGN